jgi:hypothetical protein
LRRGYAFCIARAVIPRSVFTHRARHDIRVSALTDDQRQRGQAIVDGINLYRQLSELTTVTLDDHPLAAARGLPVTGN